MGFGGLLICVQCRWGGMRKLLDEVGSSEGIIYVCEREYLRFSACGVGVATTCLSTYTSFHLHGIRFLAIVSSPITSLLLL